MEAKELPMSIGRCQSIEDGTFALIFKKTSNEVTKRNEAGVRLTASDLAELLKECQSALFSQFQNK